ncbi:hypothetical protein SAMN04244572_01997 [Azotobacter beijerinckii]|uniref:Outer membrane lipoprotein SlyB n=1 Tax=Azotobacter beijerinckii TaxID=170623 RepID=A0A1I4BS26_9GAMM|nr:hypothetical protein [Azotobacter beijerinckii]MDV7211154.1 hypothetical protein [Azotobacter beijerinckii]SEI88746.1 hypothetical protein SAMN04244572_01997 [Azotobacter beijerinckii]SEI92914.1 hypothetical protein SAMN04244579_02478 [Azotobacter beijerinckii]SFB09692.1 hypothetical protein SAMN04244571_01401 [Azotobacter beijerinckii]SFK71584.1 hypothetical protein SAMN04244574_01625 [Azotobacter beijerinckii]
MNKFGILALTLGLLTIGSVNADEIVSEAKDQTSGKATGGMSGMMIGAVGGPIGALVGAGVGALFGDSAQDVTGTSDRAYVVRTDSGELKTVRSPNRVFAVGDKVEIRGNRPYPKKPKTTALALL